MSHHLKIKPFIPFTRFNPLPKTWDIAAYLEENPVFAAPHRFVMRRSERKIHRLNSKSAKDIVS